MSKRAIIAPRFWYFLVFAVSFLISAGWILYAVVRNRPADAGGGGAIAVALSFLLLFLRRDYGRVAYEIRAKRIPALKRLISELAGKPANQSRQDAALVNQVSDLSTQMEDILELITVNANAQTLQNKYLAASSVLGTLAWGFGEWIASQIIKFVRH